MIIQLATAICGRQHGTQNQYNVSRILIPIAFVLMALERLVEFSSFFWKTKIIAKEEINSWLGILISILMLVC